ncbi:Uncharacterised protein [Arthrobacter agilis]|nr:Uncharacterised protein [Arthrobacter agilis]
MVRRPLERGELLGATAMGLASLAAGLGAHALAGGAVPGLAVLGGLAALGVLAAVLVTRCRLPGWALLLLLGLAQQLLHWLLGGLAGGPSSAAPGVSGHHVEAPPVGVAGSTGHSPEAMLMLHTHLAAALLLGWLVLRHRALLHWVRSRRRSGDAIVHGPRDDLHARAHGARNGKAPPSNDGSAFLQVDIT